MDSSSPANFYDFLDRMKHPASVDLVRSIKSFIVSFSFHAADAERDGKKLQDFLLTMEAAIKDHPLWYGATEEEIDSAIEGLEKYLMTKLFSRTFASSLADVKRDKEISEKICLLQNFVRPEHLDISREIQNETSWLLAEKELQKINAFKAPREKLLCILNCCRVINNLLLNVSMSTDRRPAGADDFLPVLIYVTIKANPPQFHSNLKYIQLYRRQSRLISEAAYYFTNMVSVESFILELDAKSLSMDENEFERNMRKAELASAENLRPVDSEPASSSGEPNPITRRHGKEIKIETYPYMEAEVGELRVGDVEDLLKLYKEVVIKYSNLCDAVHSLSLDKALALAGADHRSHMPHTLRSHPRNEGNSDVSSSDLAEESPTN
ncbi:vacuolar protein sorting-associated protein 9A isoform X2 [Amborella trichopoda]|uniref:vacuolar protein sorting-associated protein 9A isoform X2 n=1 Tax=Amborella trichopoda TaxID=13333 RepID=UPI0009BFC657|nr:vacuolar protein sorting-associated protein 9A isoform X2 [Amborella trichopoda]|eukprot:XP_020519051.1 vacuolar protein sorting-associated protein 9A isoform X2 [Amborella trichopoda]